MSRHHQRGRERQFQLMLPSRLPSPSLKWRCVALSVDEKLGNLLGENESYRIHTVAHTVQPPHNTPRHTRACNVKIQVQYATHLFVDPEYNGGERSH